jgi:DnaK suppressor protein
MKTAPFRKMLIERREALEELSRISADSRSAVELDQTKVGRVSRIDAMQQQEMAKASEAHRAIELRRIASALERMADGDYGFCIDCGEDIAVKRLEVDPANAVCIDCASN